MAGLRAVARKLLTIEVFTILEDHIVLRAMPGPEGALREIAGAYRRRLGAAPDADFTAIAAHAAALAATDEAAGAIRDHAAQLAAIAAKLGAAGADALTPEEELLVHKLWNLGTGEIAAHTAIHVDGSVVTRVDARHAAPSGQAAMAIHHASVTTATGLWKTLVDILGHFLAEVAGVLMGRR